jgi:aryl-alcohol dehydrogenase-like predicted oxidoreductase
MRLAHEVLAERGLVLVSNQVEYSLSHRLPETNDVIKTCRELDITLIAYSPLGRGVLSGKYSPGHSAKDVRRFYGQFKDKRLTRLTPLINELRQIGQNHGGKSTAEVALNWLTRQPNVLPIPGAKDEQQARDNMAAITWEMPDEEAQRLDQLSRSLRR